LNLDVIACRIAGMSKESRDQLSPNEVLVSSLPEVAQELDSLWSRFANTTIGFAGGGTGKDELGRNWANKVSGLLEDCTIPTVAPEGWGELITTLNDLSEGLKLHFSPLRNEQPRLTRNMTYFRMDRDANYLLDTFEERGYLKRNEPFIAPKRRV